MNKNKIFIFTALILLGLGSLLVSQSLSIGKLRLIACDVGQGDGMLIIAPNGAQIVVDGGPGNRISDCLARHMPFWDRTVEMIILTHPQADHMQGFLDVFARYQVKTVLTTGVVNKTGLFNHWTTAISRENSKVVHPYAGDQVQVGAMTMQIIWPPKDKAEIWKLSPPADLNDTSIVMRVTYGSFCMYLTGDLPKEILGKIIPGKCQVLKVVHHGSRTGTDARVLEAIDPELAVIQAGFKNQYGHPHKEVIDALSAKGIKILRNDINGEVEVDSDGKSWSVRSER